MNKKTKIKGKVALVIVAIIMLIIPTADKCSGGDGGSGGVVDTSNCEKHEDSNGVYYVCN
jgi:hypothetical protein